MADPQGVSFEVHVVGEETFETFTGKFRAKEKLSWADRMASDRFRRELLGPNGAEADLSAQNRAMILGELSVRLTEAPDWWKTSRGGLDLVDDNIVMKIYEESVGIQTKWQEAQKAKGEAAKKALAEKQATPAKKA